jgi:hypothetical protein
VVAPILVLLLAVVLLAVVLLGVGRLDLFD